MVSTNIDLENFMRNMSSCFIFALNRTFLTTTLLENVEEFDTHRSVHSRLLSRNTNKMQLCYRIYYSKVFLRLNMFRGAHRSSSGALNCICSLWFICYNKVKNFVYIIHSPYYNIIIVFLI